MNFINAGDSGYKDYSLSSTIQFLNNFFFSGCHTYIPGMEILIEDLIWFKYILILFILSPTYVGVLHLKASHLRQEWMWKKESLFGN